MDLVVRNIVFIGDGTVGKTCLLFAYSNHGGFRVSYEPTIYDRGETELILDNVKHLIKLHDTAGQEDYERIREIIYKDNNVDCFVLCYSVADRETFENISSKWYPEIAKYNCPIVLVATKTDLARGPNIVSKAEGEKMKRKINANQFLGCSAKNYVNINEVIYEAVRACVAGRPEPKEKSCFDILRNFVMCSDDEH